MRYNFEKLAQKVEMSFEIPSAEKAIAEESKSYFESASHNLTLAVQHLNVIYDPFVNHPDVPTDSVVKHRGLLTRLSNKVRDNFQKVQVLSLQAVKNLHHFSTGDMEIQELINSYVEAIDNISDDVSAFIHLLRRNYHAQDFREKVIKLVEKIRKSAKEMQTLIYDRVIDHIDTNILAKDWMDDARDKMNVEIEEHIPNVIRLFKERQQKINPENFPAAQKDPQSMNASDAQKVHYPDSIRNMQGTLGGM